MSAFEQPFFFGIGLGGCYDSLLRVGYPIAILESERSKCYAYYDALGFFHATGESEAFERIIAECVKK